MAQALFISEQWLKDNSVIDENVDPKLIRPAILEAQDIQIHPILGTDLYNKLKADVIASTLAGVYLTLMDDYITHTLKYYTLVDLSPEMLVKYMNKSVVEKNSENSSSIDDAMLVRMMGRWNDKAEWYAQRMIDYLCENESSFPEYQNPGSGKDIIKPEKGTVYSQGMYLGLDNYEPDREQTLEERNQD